jgi:hypothetical protein
MGILESFHQNQIPDREPIEKNIVCFGPIATTHPTCVFLLLVNDSRSCIRCGSYFFTIVVGVDIIKGAANKVCNFVSIGVGPLYITSS